MTGLSSDSQVKAKHRHSAARRHGAATARRRAAGGFTLLEVMIAAIVLVFAITTSITTLQSGMQALDTARNLTHASQLMQSELEQLRLKTWSQIQALQDAGDATITSSAAGGGEARFSCTRTIRDIKADMKEIVVTSEWRGYDGRPHSVRYITRYGKAGLYDYFYTAH